MVLHFTGMLQADPMVRLIYNHEPKDRTALVHATKAKKRVQEQFHSFVTNKL